MLRYFFHIYKSSFIERFIFGLISVALVLAINTAVTLVFKNYIPMSLFLISVVVAAWFGGISVGMIATFMGGLIEIFLYSKDFWNLPLNDVEVVRIIVYLIQGVVISFIFGELRLIQQEIVRHERYLSESLHYERENLKNLSEHQKDIQRAKSKAEEANELKSLFLANMSHEIRTPLVSILGFAELLRDSNLNKETVRRYGSIIERTGNELLQIINDILDLSKVEADRMELEAIPFSLPALLDDLYLMLKVRAEQKGLDLVFFEESEIPKLIVSDPTRLRQILMNLIGNALKFTEVGFVSLRYRVVGNQLTFTIQDSGIGISEEQRMNLFENFGQGDSSIARNYSGTGLGLALSRRLAKMMNGNVILKDSRPGKGSTFVVKVQFTSVSPLCLTQKDNNMLGSRRIDLTDKSILVVDDSVDNQFLIKTILSEWGPRVVLANNGKEAIEWVQKENFDLILMDMQMPIMDGYTASKELKQSLCETPIIALTANAMKEDRDRCIDAGCQDYLCKPIQKQQLFEVLQRNINDQSA